MIDVHLHLFSRIYFEALAAQSPLPGSVPERLDRLAAASGIEIPGPDLAAHVRRWLSEMDRHGVESGRLQQRPRGSPRGGRGGEACRRADSCLWRS